VNEADEFELEFHLTSSFERVTRRGTVSEDVRQRAAQRMCDAFTGDTAVEAQPSSKPSELLVLLDQGPPERPHRATLMGAAAVLALLIIGLVAMMSPARDTSDQAAGSGSSKPPELAGRYETDAFGGTVRFTAPPLTRLTRLGPGVVELTLGASPDASTVTIAHATALAEQFELAGITTITDLLDASPGTQRTPSAVGGLAAQHWRWANPTNDGLCENDACSDLFDTPDGVGIAADRTTDIWVVDTAIGTQFVVIASLHPDDFELSPPEVVAGIAGSLDLRGLDRPVPAGAPTIEPVDASMD
jgi:hypothetical protein